jgi:oligoendopeptidase F
VQGLAQQLGVGEAASGIRADFVDIPWGGLCVAVHAPDDVRILMNPSDGHRYYETLFHEYGHGLHWRHIAQPMHVFRDEPGPFCEGMACTLARFTDEPDWLANRKGLAASAVQQHRLDWRGQMSLHLRRLIGLASFEFALYADPAANALELYRTSMGDSLGVTFEAGQAWADNLYWTSYPLYVQNYVVAEMITSQTHAALRREFGATIHPSAGDWLTRHYWAKGGSVEWPDKVAQATGAALAPDQLLRELEAGFPAG